MHELTQSQAPHLGAARNSVGRMAWLDRTKGIGILLVVFGHAWLGLANAGVLSDPVLVGSVERLIYSFHMPLFFLLSGWTFEGWARRRRPGAALRDRLARLIWPMILWTYVFIAFRIAAGSSANTQVGTDALLTWPLPPQDHLWFLWALFLIQCLVYPVAALGNQRVPGLAWLVLAALAVTAISVPGLPVGDLTASAAYHLGIFLLGMGLSRVMDLPRGPGALMAALALFAGLEWLVLTAPDTLTVGLLLACGLSVSFCVIIRNLDRVPGMAMLEWLGTYSMGIYLAHTIFTAATRTVLLKLTENHVPHLVLGTAAGIAGPLVLYVLLQRLNAVRLAGF